VEENLVTMGENCCI